MAGTAVSGRGWPVQLGVGWKAWPPHNKQQRKINRKCVWNWWGAGRGMRGSPGDLFPSLATPLPPHRRAQLSRGFSLGAQDRWGSRWWDQRQDVLSMWSQRGPLRRISTWKIPKERKGSVRSGKAGGRGWSLQAGPMGHQGAHRPSRHPLLWPPPTPHQGYRPNSTCSPLFQKRKQADQGAFSSVPPPWAPQPSLRVPPFPR